MGTKTVAQAIESLLAGLNDSGTPSPNYYLDQVWIGKPEKIPMGARAIAYVELAQDPTFYYTTCKNATQHDSDYVITVLTKGRTEIATPYLYDLRDIVVAGLLNAPTLSGSAIHSTIEEIVYGEYIGEKNNIITGFRLTLRVKIPTY